MLNYGMIDGISGGTIFVHSMWRYSTGATYLCLTLLLFDLTMHGNKYEKKLGTIGGEIKAL